MDLFSVVPAAMVLTFEVKKIAYWMLFLSHFKMKGREGGWDEVLESKRCIEHTSDWSEHFINNELTIHQLYSLIW